MQNSKATTRSALIFMGVVAVSIVAMFLLVSASKSDGPKLKTSTSAQTGASQTPNLAGTATTDNAIQEDHGSVNAGSYQGSLISFPMPVGFSNLQQAVGQGQERVDFDLNAEHETVRVSTQALSSTSPSLTSLVAIYAGQGQIAQRSFGSRKAYVVTSTSPNEVSLLALTETDAQLVTVQVVTTPSEKAAAEQLLAHLVSDTQVGATGTDTATTTTAATVG